MQVARQVQVVGRLAGRLVPPVDRPDRAQARGPAAQVVADLPVVVRQVAAGRVVDRPVARAVVLVAAPAVVRVAEVAAVAGNSP